VGRLVSRFRRRHDRSFEICRNLECRRHRIRHNHLLKQGITIAILDVSACKIEEGMPVHADLQGKFGGAAPNARNL
jgi:hypothetical protein